MSSPAKIHRTIFTIIFAVPALFVAACTQPSLTGPTGTSVADLTETYAVFDAADALEKKWRAVKVWSESEWKQVVLGGEIAIQPVVNKSSTALTRWVEFDTKDCPVAEWSWRVDELPEGADLTSRDTEDMAVSVLFVFGDPGAFTNPNPVPTIRYVWSAGREPKDAIIKSPYFPEHLRNVVVRSGPAPGEWVTERRNLREDYREIFGEYPTERVQVFALFSDNDHNGQPITAWYRWARMLCSELPDPESIL